MYIYHALINALSAHMIHINLNMILPAPAHPAPPLHPPSDDESVYSGDSWDRLPSTHTHACTHTHTHTTHERTHIHKHTTHIRTHYTTQHCTHTHIHPVIKRRQVDRCIQCTCWLWQRCSQQYSNASATKPSAGPPYPPLCVDDTCGGTAVNASQSSARITAHFSFFKRCISPTRVSLCVCFLSFLSAVSHQPGWGCFLSAICHQQGRVLFCFVFLGGIFLFLSAVSHQQEHAALCRFMSNIHNIYIFKHNKHNIPHTLAHTHTHTHACKTETDRQGQHTDRCTEKKQHFM